MQIFIENKEAALKEGSSIEYISENFLFTKSDSYTLNIELPLEGCEQNQKIFGNLSRKDVIARKIIYDCEIRDKDFYRSGSATITEISDSIVKIQFLEGRSAQNFQDSLDNLFINELELGSPSQAGADDSRPEYAWDPERTGTKCVALPWVNDASGNLQNMPVFSDETGQYSWHEDCKGRSWQPYLVYLTKQICKAVGYEYDFSTWESSEEYKYLLVCNTLPWAWDLDDFGRALPHWSVKEYFEKLEPFLDGEFKINHKKKLISFDFTEENIKSLQPVHIDNVVDEYTTEITAEDEKCEYQEIKNLVYKDGTHQMSKFYSCDWFVKTWTKYPNALKEYETLSELLKENRQYRAFEGYNKINGRKAPCSYILYAKDVDTYFIFRSLYKTFVSDEGYKLFYIPAIYETTMELRPINVLGGRIADDKEDADKTEIEFVPVCIDFTEEKYGYAMFLSFSGYDESETTQLSANKTQEEHKKEIDATLFQPRTVNALEAGEEKEKAEYYDRIYIAWYNGAQNPKGKLPRPYVEDILISDDWTYYTHLHFSLRLSDRTGENRRSILHQIEPKQKTTFKFLADTIPDPKAVFYIQGKKYLCEKLTATITEHGISQLIKGDFYLITE